MEESPIITSLAGIRGLQASRRELLAGGIETSAFRLVDGEGDGLKGVYVDELAGHWIVHTKERGLPREWEGAVEAGLCQSVWWKMLDNVDKRAPVCVVGYSEESFPAEEGGLRYEIQPAAGYNCGLFIDQRLNRSRVRKWTLPGQTVLNLFSYTCSFSVAAASSGATATSVDLNGSYLDWGKRNFELNGLSPDEHHWVKGDSFDWLALFAKKGRVFDGVILDPPTFSRGKKKKVFRVEHDYAELAALAATVVAPGGWLLSSANTHRQTQEAFEMQVDAGVRRAGRRFRQRDWMTMPADFTGESYLKGLWLSDGD